MAKHYKLEKSSITNRDNCQEFTARPVLGERLTVGNARNSIVSGHLNQDRTKLPGSAKPVVQRLRGKRSREPLPPLPPPRSLPTNPADKRRTRRTRGDLCAAATFPERPRWRGSARPASTQAPTPPPAAGARPGRGRKRPPPPPPARAGPMGGGRSEAAAAAEQAPAGPRVTQFGNPPARPRRDPPR